MASKKSKTLDEIDTIEELTEYIRKRIAVANDEELDYRNRPMSEIAAEEELLKVELYQENLWKDGLHGTDVKFALPVITDIKYDVALRYTIGFMERYEVPEEKLYMLRRAMLVEAFYMIQKVASESEAELQDEDIDWQ